MRIFSSLAGVVVFCAAICLASQGVYAGGSVELGTVDVVVTPVNGGFNWDYRVTNTSTNPNVNTITGIEIPELHTGDLTPEPGKITNCLCFTAQSSVTSNVTAAFFFPAGWTFSEVGTPGFGSPTLKPSGAPSDFVVISTAPNTVGSVPVDFNFFSAFGGSANADVALQFNGAAVVQIDPPIPNSSIPEPGTILTFSVGLAALASRRRRRA